MISKESGIRALTCFLLLVITYLNAKDFARSFHGRDVSDSHQLVRRLSNASPPQSPRGLGPIQQTPPLKAPMGPKPLPHPGKGDNSESSSNGKSNGGSSNNGNSSNGGSSSKSGGSSSSGGSSGNGGSSNGGGSSGNGGSSGSSSNSGSSSSSGGSSSNSGSSANGESNDSSNNSSSQNSSSSNNSSSNSSSSNSEEESNDNYGGSDDYQSRYYNSTEYEQNTQAVYASSSTSNNFAVMIAAVSAAVAGILSLAGVIFMLYTPPAKDDDAIEMPYLAPDYGDFNDDNSSLYNSASA